MNRPGGLISMCLPAFTIPYPFQNRCHFGGWVLCPPAIYKDVPTMKTHGHTGLPCVGEASKTDPSCLGAQLAQSIHRGASCPARGRGNFVPHSTWGDSNWVRSTWVNVFGAHWVTSSAPGPSPCPRASAHCSTPLQKQRSTALSWRGPTPGNC